MNVFGRKKREEDNELVLEVPGLPPKTTYLGKHMKIRGNITGEDNLHIDGKIEGDIKSSGDVKISKYSSTEGNIHAGSISSSGMIKGNIKADKKLILEATAKVNGKIKTPAVTIAEGAIFDGEMAMCR